MVLGALGAVSGLSWGGFGAVLGILGRSGAILGSAREAQNVRDAGGEVAERASWSPPPKLIAKATSRHL